MAAAVRKNQAHETPKQAPTIGVSSAGAKVTVGCKMAVAWFDLELCERTVVSENTQTGPRDVVMFNRTGNIVRVRGTAYPTGITPEGFGDRPTMVAGCALTPNVPKDFWDAWVLQHAKAPYVLNKMIFAYETRDGVSGQAKELKDETSGLEPIQRTKDKITDPRVVKSQLKAVGELEPGVRE